MTIKEESLSKIKMYTWNSKTQDCSLHVRYLLPRVGILCEMKQFLQIHWIILFQLTSHQQGSDPHQLQLVGVDVPPVKNHVENAYSEVQGFLA